MPTQVLEPYLTIRMPVAFPRARGLNSTADKFGTIVRMRMTKEEQELVQQEAENLGMTVSMFARVLVVETSVALKQRREKDDERQQGGTENATA